MSDLENHFGDDASLDVETNKNILAFLLKNSAETSTTEASFKFLQSIKNQDIIALSKTTFWEKTHKDIPKEIFDNEKIKAVSNDYGYKSWIAVIIIQIMIALFFKRERFNYYKNKVQISVKKFTHILNNNKYSKHIIKYYLLYVMSIAIIWIIFQRFL